ncbi:MAG: alanine--glyoxylate aminotransferase family protein [Anaerolineales bacterium]|nr:alanine--glyoxylate aminotransferase family protein [Anaerolineales bacterium]
MSEKKLHSAFNVPERILLGPGPSNMPPSVSQALAMPVIGHLDPIFLQVMDEVQGMLRQLFQTKNRLTIPVSGTGSAGMEAALSNFIEPGDRVLIGVIGYFGERMVAMAERYGAEVHRLEVPWGQALDLDEVKAALGKHKYKFLAVVHGETSSGVRQPQIAELAAAAHQHGALFILDTVASLGGVPVETDAWDVDVAFSGSQKALSASPGLAPITIGPRAEEALAKRKTQVGNWYLSLGEVQKYWGGERTYHHTAPVQLNYALHEALRLALDEGLEARYARHQHNAETLWSGLEALDMEMLVARENRLATVTSVRVPPSASHDHVKNSLLNDYGIEIGAGLGQLKGQIWRIGLMGHSSQRKYVSLVLAALREILSG